MDATLRLFPGLFFMLWMPLAAVAEPTGGDQTGGASADTSDPAERYADQLVDQPPAQGASREWHITAPDSPENGLTPTAEGGIVVPTSAGILRLDVHPIAARQAPGAPSGPAAGPSRPPETPAARTIVLILTILAGAYLAGSVLRGWRGKRPARFSMPAQAVGPAEAQSPWQGNYSIVRIIGRGGMGVVYEAYDRSLERRVAIKRMREEIRENFGGLDRFVKEAKTVAALHHPAIVDIYSIVQQAGELYLVFEFVEGRTVEALLTEKGRLSVAETKRILEPVCRALEFAHERGVIHRDLKPANVMVTAQGFVKVMDFGIARRAQDGGERGAAPLDSLQMTNTLAGTPLYMAPEAERGLVGPGSDIFSLGIMTYEMLAGRSPYTSPATAQQKEARSYPKLSRMVPSMPPELDAFMDAVLEPNVERRLGSARGFWDRFAAFA